MVLPCRASQGISRISRANARLVFLLLVLFLTVSAESRDKSKETETSRAKEPYKPMDLKDSVKKTWHKDAQAAREKYWRKTLDEIRNLAVTFPQQDKSNGDTKNSFNKWKKFSSGKYSQSKPARFDGFFTWERLLQQWSDDVQDYLDKIETESKEQYSMSTFGVPNTETEDPIAASPPSPVSDEVKTEGSATKKVPRPVPAPRKPGEEVLSHTDISDKSKRVWVITTAALPWMTGTAVNPLLRAAYLCKGRKEGGGSVTLMLPWLERTEDQERVYGSDKTFDTPADQEAYIRNWLKNSAKMPDSSEELNIEWYTAWQNRAENSVYSMGDIIATISEDDVDIMVLEEPEHLNWYRAPGESWTQKFKHVVGIMHTNYFVYAQDQPGALVRAPAMKLLCTWMCRSHCHRLIKLSGTLGEYAPEKELIENTHGVRGAFLDAGMELRDRLRSPDAYSDPIFGPDAEPTVYFIGKMLWSKGIGSLMELLKYAEESAGIRLKVDMYGGGPDKDAAEAKAGKLELEMDFKGPIDHPELAMTHKIFINPSTSEVLCTTVAEALAMGKFVILPSHPSNDFFVQFPNCLPYASQEEFVGNLYYALTHSPEPLSEEYSYALSWDAATERFEAAACIPVEEAVHYKKWVESGDAGVEITLPPLIEDEEGRKLVASTLRRSRESFRKFRDALAQEISITKVLPKKLKDRLIKDLDSRLDLDIDELVSSPKLELKLSPAELDRQCLELYQTLAQGPGGDVLRAIGGGQEVALQHQYMRRQARNQLKAAQAMNLTSPFVVDRSVDSTDARARTPSQWVKWTMKKNLPTNGTDFLVRVPPVPVDDKKPITTHWKDERRNNLHMCGSQSMTNRRTMPVSSQPQLQIWGQQYSSFAAISRRLSSRSMSKTFKLLI